MPETPRGPESPETGSPTEVRVPIDLPDALRQIPPEQRVAGLWRTDGACGMAGVGRFAACLLPVRLTGGITVTFGTWISVTDEQPAGYQAGAELTGTLANAIEPWGAPLLGAPARAQARDPGGPPHVNASGHALLSRVLCETWDRDAVLSTVAIALPVPVRHRLDEHWSIERSAGLTPRLVRGRQRFVGSGREVLMSSYATEPDRGAEDVLRSVIDGAQTTGEPLIERDGAGTHIRYAMRTSAEVGGSTRHELYGFTIGPGGFLETVCIHDDPADATWALDVWRSVRQHE